MKAEMKCSEAIVLGDTLKHGEPLIFLRKVEEGWCGCALGGAQLALGVTEIEGFYRLWPWLRESPPGYSKALDYAFHIGGGLGHANYMDVSRGLYTLDELVEYVRSVEPQCACGRHGCDCVHEAAPEAVQEAVCV